MYIFSRLPQIFQKLTVAISGRWRSSAHYRENAAPNIKDGSNLDPFFRPMGSIMAGMELDISLNI